MRTRLFGVDEPAKIYLLGADYRGRDLFSRILYGSRVSLSIGFVGVAVSFSVGMLVGGISGFFGGRTDNLLMRLCEMVMMIPGFYLMLALRAAFPPDLSSVEVYLMIVLIMSFIGWAGLARVIRGMVLSIREKEFVTAAHASGQGSLRIIVRHILPNTLSYVIVAVTLSIPSYILGESALSLIGLGIQEPYASWGNLLSEAMNIAEIKFHPWILIPGLFIFVTVMSFNFLGDGLRDAFDPRIAFEGKE
jgi:peptide/nickel transport system permease protein